MFIKNSMIVLTLIVLCFGVWACDPASEVVDVDPPAPPNGDLVFVSGPDVQGLLTIVGAAGAVEGGATVLAHNRDADTDGSGTAAGNGSFSFTVTGELMDEIELRARDEAGNNSGSFTLVMAGAPFSLLAISGGAQSGAVGEPLEDPLVFELRDSSGGTVSGVNILFALASGAGTFDPDAAITDAEGRVSTALTLGETAGDLIIRPLGESLSIATVQDMTATALPGPPAQLAWVEGDGQKDGPGETLLVRPVIEVQDSYRNAIADQEIDLAADGGGDVTPSSGTTNSEGQLTCDWTLGPGNGAYNLTASATDLDDAVATATADDPPSISSVNPTTPVDPGDLIIVDGLNFCETALYNDLRLDDELMEMVAASETHLSARIPAGTLQGTYTLSLRVGHQEAPQTAIIEIVQPLGIVEDHPFVAGEVEVELLVPGISTRYAVIPYSIALAGAYEPATYGIDNPVLFKAAALDRSSSLVEEFHHRVHERPENATPYQGERVSRPRERALGDRVPFYCMSTLGSTNDPGNYSEISATLKYSGSQTLIYVDDDTPPANLPQDKIDELGDRFNDTDYGIDTAAFGQPSDIDSNGKVIILLSPVVNALTTWSDGSYIGGFFNAIDLDIWNVPAGTSNHGEFFYAIVPDPSGQFSPVTHQVEQTVESLKSIFAHEFQHMINTGQRYILQGNSSWSEEELWLNEGLSHLAENLCGYHPQNTARVKLHLHSGVHAITSLTRGGNGLAERGASYLFCRYLEDRWPGTALGLIGNPEVGPDNVVGATGVSFEQLFKDWVAAIYLDDRDLDGDGSADDLGPAYRFDSYNLRTDFPYQSGQEDALSIPDIFFHMPAATGSIVPTAMDYLHYSVMGGQSPPDGNSITLSFTAPTYAEMGVLVLRVSH